MLLVLCRIRRAVAITETGGRAGKVTRRVGTKAPGGTGGILQASTYGGAEREPLPCACGTDEGRDGRGDLDLSR